jgi:hypothetical protein
VQHPPKTQSDQDAVAAHEQQVLQRELERRLRLLSDADETEFGSFTALDWWITLLCFLLLPILFIWFGA